MSSLYCRKAPITSSKSERNTTYHLTNNNNKRKGYKYNEDIKYTLSEKKEKLLYSSLGHSTCLYTTSDQVILYLLGPIVLSIVVVLICSQKVQNGLEQRISNNYMRLIVIASVFFIISFLMFRWYNMFYIHTVACKH